MGARARVCVCVKKHAAGGSKPEKRACRSELRHRSAVCCVRVRVRVNIRTRGPDATSRKRNALSKMMALGEKKASPLRYL